MAGIFRQIQSFIYPCQNGRCQVVVEQSKFLACSAKSVACQFQFRSCCAWILRHNFKQISGCCKIRSSVSVRKGPTQVEEGYAVNSRLSFFLILKEKKLETCVAVFSSFRSCRCFWIRQSNGFSVGHSVLHRNHRADEEQQAIPPIMRNWGARLSIPVAFQHHALEQSVRVV